MRNFKPVRDNYGVPVYEVVSNRQNARLFVFYDPDDDTLIGIGRYWKQGRSRQSERFDQPRAIDDAVARRDMLLTAERIPGLDKFRVLRGRRY